MMHEYNPYNNSTDKDQNDEERNSQQFKNISHRPLE